MSIIATALKHLMAAGVSGDDLVRAVAEMEAATDTRSTAAKRQARYRDRNKASQSVTRVTSDAGDDPPNDIYSNPPEPSEAKASPSPLIDRIVGDWNAGPAARGARKATRLDTSRKNLLKARLRDHTEAEVLGAIANLAASKFHCGENDRGWRANLGWFLKAENFLKALEMGGGEKPASTGQFDTPEARAAYLAKLERDDKPWSRPPDRPPDRPAAFSQPPRTIGQLVQNIAQEHAA